ncbi:Protein CBR-DHS-1 [Aphelenchoides bicaudatus]|nr:Protein CBR-DHS-1 [Aphelenchoides bicaudatus]
MSGLKAIITGATSGIGLHTLKRLCNSGSFEKIIGLGRDVKNCEEAFNEIKLLEKNTTIVEFIECDLTKLQCVREFASTVIQKIPEIDLLVCNAGVMDTPLVFTNYGVEVQFATNHLGHFLLTKLLLNNMAPDSRIINISSGMYTKAAEPPTWKSVHEPPSLEPRGYYAQSKLANCLFTVALNEHIEKNQEALPHIKVAAVRPGFIRNTNLGRYHSQFLRILATPLIYYFSKDLNFGTDTIVHLTFAPFEEIESGKLYYDKKVESYTPLVTGDNAKNLWDLSERLLETAEKEVE